ncbi:MAG: undecaprenyl-diphosphate phosphatase, partial [Aestuariivirga sp.]
MSILQIIVLALIQGTTEFLPVSSSGHLILVPALTGWPDQGLVTDMVTNLGTFFAVIVYFWFDVLAMLRGAIDTVKRQPTRQSRLLLNVLIGTVPIVAVGLIMKATHLDDHIRSTVLVACNTIIFGVLLYVFDAFGLARRTVADMTWKTSLIIGCA